MKHRDRDLRQLYTRAVDLIDGFSAELPPYQTLPPSLVEADFVRGVRLNLRLFFRYLIGGVEPTATDTAELVELAAARVRDGVPLDDVLNHYRLATSMVWSKLTATAAQPERELLLDAALPMAQYLALATARIATGCLDRANDPRWEQLERRRALADALLTGTDPGEWTHDPDNPIADRFLVLVVRLAANGDTNHTAVTALRNRIDTMPGTFLRLDGGGVTALIPLDPHDDGTAAAKLESDLAVPTGVWLATSPAHNHAAVPAAFHEASVLAELGRCLNHPEPFCHRTALLFEYTVAVSGHARDRLTETLAPLADQPVLTETLKVFLNNECNQLATARLLNVHRNTITYRLTRIAELTGLDPSRPTQAITLSAAQTAQTLTTTNFTLP